MSEQDEDDNKDRVRRDKVPSPSVLIHHKSSRPIRGKVNKKISVQSLTKSPAVQEDADKDKNEEEEGSGRSKVGKKQDEKKEKKQAGRPVGFKEDLNLRNDVNQEKYKYITPQVLNTSTQKLKQPCKNKQRAPIRKKSGSKPNQKTPQSGASDRSSSEKKDSESPKEPAKDIGLGKVVIPNRRISHRRDDTKPTKDSKKKLEKPRKAYFHNEEEEVSTTTKLLSVQKDKKPHCPTLQTTIIAKPRKPQKDKMAGAQEYPTMDDVLSDWGDDEEPQKAKKSPR